MSWLCELKVNEQRFSSLKSHLQTLFKSHAASLCDITRKLKVIRQDTESGGEL